MNIADEGFNLFTRISSSTLSRMKKLESGLSTSTPSNGRNGVTGQVANKARNVNLKAIQPALKSNEVKTTLEKPKPVSLVNVSKEALNDLKSIISKQAVDSAVAISPKGKKPISTVAKYLAAAAATYGILSNFKLENIPGLIQGLQGARRQVLKLKRRMRRVFNGLKNAAKRLIPKNLRATLRANISKFRKSAIDAVKSAKKSIVNGVKNMGTRIVTMSKDLGKIALEKLTKNFNSFRTAAMGALRSAKGLLTSTIDNMATSVTRMRSSIPRANPASATRPQMSMPRSSPSVSGSSASGGFLSSMTPNWMKNAYKTSANFVSTQADNLTTGARNLGNSALEVVGDAGKALKNKGGQVLDATVDAGKYVGGKVRQGAAVVADTTVDAAKYTFKQGVRALGGVKYVAKAILKSPLLAPLVESIFTYIDINKAIKEYNKGELKREELDKRVGKRAIQGVGGLAGGLLGAGLGVATLGSLSFGLAAPLGAIIGGVGGDMAGRFLGGVVADVMGDKTGGLGSGIIDSKFFKNKLLENQSKENASGESKAKKEKPVEIEDGIITKTGQLIKPHAQDFIYAMKEGGPLTNAMDNDNIIAKKTHVLLDEANKASQNIMNSQTKILNENTKLLKQFLDKEASNNNIVSSNSNTTNINYKSSGLRELQLKYV